MAKLNKNLIIIHSFKLGSVGYVNFIEPKVARLSPFYNIEIILVPPGVFGIIRSLNKIYSLSVVNADFVHVEWASLLGFACSFLPVTKLITLRGSDWYYLNVGVSFKVRLKSWLSTRLTRSAIKRYSRVLCVSQRMASEIHAECGLKAVVFTTPVDTNQIFFKSKSEACSELKIDTEKVRILFLSAEDQNPVKRSGLAREAISILQSRHENVEFLEISRKTKSEINNYINASDLLLITSIHEGWPNVVKEALICGCPICSHRCQRSKSY